MFFGLGGGDRGPRPHVLVRNTPLAEYPQWLEDHKDELDLVGRWYNAFFQLRGPPPHYRQPTVRGWVAMSKKHKLWPQNEVFDPKRHVPPHFQDPWKLSKLFPIEEQSGTADGFLAELAKMSQQKVSARGVAAQAPLPASDTESDEPFPSQPSQLQPQQEEKAELEHKSPDSESEDIPPPPPSALLPEFSPEPSSPRQRSPSPLDSSDFQFSSDEGDYTPPSMGDFDERVGVAVRRRSPSPPAVPDAPEPPKLHQISVEEHTDLVVYENELLLAVPLPAASRDFVIGSVDDYGLVAAGAVALQQKVGGGTAQACFDGLLP